MNHQILRVPSFTNKAFRVSNITGEGFNICQGAPSYVGALLKRQGAKQFGTTTAHSWTSKDCTKVSLKNHEYLDGRTLEGFSSFYVWSFMSASSISQGINKEPKCAFFTPLQIKNAGLARRSASFREVTTHEFGDDMVTNMRQNLWYTKFIHSFCQSISIICFVNILQKTHTPPASAPKSALWPRELNAYSLRQSSNNSWAGQWTHCQAGTRSVFSWSCWSRSALWNNSEKVDKNIQTQVTINM